MFDLTVLSSSELTVIYWFHEEGTITEAITMAEDFVYSIEAIEEFVDFNLSSYRMIKASYENETHYWYLT